jgi:hypothetical protein
MKKVMTTNPTITVEEALEELYQTVGPVTTISRFERWSYITPNHASYTINVGERRFNAPTLAECMAQIRTWKQEQRG